MKKTRYQRYHIYLTETDNRILKKISNEYKQSKSATIRKLIQTNKYKNVLNEIEINNKIISEYLKEFTHMGTNINQIAYHLNANIIEHEEAKTDLERSMIELIKKMKDLNEKVKTLKIEINVDHTKTPSQGKE